MKEQINKSTIVGIIKYHLYDDDDHKKYPMFKEMFQPLVIATCCEPGCMQVAALLFDIYHDEEEFAASPLATWTVGGFLGPEEGSYAFCHGLHSNNAHITLLRSGDRFTGVQVRGFTTSWRAAQLANQLGYSAGYTGPSATIYTEPGGHQQYLEKPGKLNHHR